MNRKEPSIERDGAVWMGTQDYGLLHVHRGRIDRFSRADGLSGNFVPDLFEDREGNVWVATINGLDRFRDFETEAAWAMVHCWDWGSACIGFVVRTRRFS